MENLTIGDSLTRLFFKYERTEIVSCYWKIQIWKNHFGYHPSPSKSWCICSAAAEPPSRDAFAALGLDAVKWCRGHRYVGGFVGSAALRDRWVEPQVAKWVEGVEALAKVAVRFPQAAYTGFAHCLQAEWQYLSRCVPAMGPLLAPIEDAIHDKLIPALLGGMSDRPSREDFCRLVANSVRFGGMAIRHRQVQGTATAAREAREHEEELFCQQLTHHRSSRKDGKRLARIPKSGA